MLEANIRHNAFLSEAFSKSKIPRRSASIKISYYDPSIWVGEIRFWTPEQTIEQGDEYAYDSYDYHTETYEHEFFIRMTHEGKIFGEETLRHRSYHAESSSNTCDKYVYETWLWGEETASNATPHLSIVFEGAAFTPYEVDASNVVIDADTRFFSIKVPESGLLGWDGMVNRRRKETSYDCHKGPHVVHDRTEPIGRGPAVAKPKGVIPEIKGVINGSNSEKRLFGKRTFTSYAGTKPLKTYVSWDLVRVVKALPRPGGPYIP
jgi:hypothetical protein